MSRPQKVHTHLAGSAATARVEDEDEERDDGEKQSSSKMSSEPEEPCHKWQSDETFSLSFFFPFTNFCATEANTNFGHCFFFIF